MGADINSQSGRYGTALKAAKDQGFDLIVRILLDGGAEPVVDDNFAFNNSENSSVTLERQTHHNSVPNLKRLGSDNTQANPTKKPVSTDQEDRIPMCGVIVGGDWPICFLRAWAYIVSRRRRRRGGGNGGGGGSGCGMVVVEW
jgi:hypothetical protein